VVTGRGVVGDIAVTRKAPPLAFQVTEGVVAGRGVVGDKEDPSTRVSSDGGDETKKADVSKTCPSSLLMWRLECKVVK
jgi:hypothetical protein